MKILSLLPILFILGCAAVPTRAPSGERIERGVNTVVSASNKSAKDYYKELKMRLVEKGFYFKHTDDDTNSFITEFLDVGKKVMAQITVYVKDVDGGSNAVTTGKYKRITKEGYSRPKRISHNGKAGKPKHQAWKAFHDYAVDAESGKYNFLKR